MVRTLRMSTRSFGVISAGVFVAVSGCAHHHHHGQEGGHARAERTMVAGLTVVGTGEAKGPPDIARSTIGIEMRGASAEQATTQANQKMEAVIVALKNAGIADADLRTSDFSISFERDYTPPTPVVQVVPEKGGVRKTPTPATPAAPAATEPRGAYRVTNMVEVTVRDISKTSKVLTAATDAGANNVWEVSFEIADREVLHAQARAQAIARAQQSAAQLVKLTGQKLGRIIAIEDEPAASGGAVYTSMRSEKAMAAAPIEPGQRTVMHQVRLVYELARP